ncbi:hypothetical protein ACQP3F_29930, partial [Escherichia coli]
KDFLNSVINLPVILKDESGTTTIMNPEFLKMPSKVNVLHVGMCPIFTIILEMNTDLIMQKL